VALDDELVLLHPDAAHVALDETLGVAALRVEDEDARDLVVERAAGERAGEEADEQTEDDSRRLS
jgi:hypothetical protein